MSNIVQFEDSNCRSNKGKEKAQGRPSNKRSIVWDGFEEMEESDGTRMAKCLHCGKKLCCDSKKHGTTHLKRHLDKGCPKKVAKITLSDSPECHENQELNECQDNHLGYDLHNDQEVSRCQDLAYNQQRNREFFVKMVIDNRTMLKHVENPFLKEFALTLQPLYSPLDQRTVEKDCLTFYENEKAKLKYKLSQLKSRVSFSFINCVTVKYFGNYCVAAYFTDNNFKLEKRIVGFTNALISIDAKKDFLNEWTSGKTVLATTCISANFFPIGKFMRCILCHLKQIAAIFFSEITRYRVLGHIHDILEKLMQSHEQMSSFNKIAEKHSLPPKAEFILHDKRGLGSDFNIFHDAYTYKEVLLELGNIQWNVVEEVVGLLKPINDTVAVLSSSECPTINSLVKLVLDVKDGMSNASPSPVLSSTKTAVNKSVAELEGYLASCDEMVHFASLLDPQLKSWFLEHCNGRGGMPDKNEILRRFHNSYIAYQNESTEISNNPKDLDEYLESHSVDETDDENIDVLGWWKRTESEYPILSRMARDILAIPITCSLTSGTEPLEEILGEICQSGISLKMSEVLICCNNWLRSNCNYGMTSIPSY